MSVFRFDSRLISAHPEVFSLVQDRFARRIINYILHSDYRQSTSLVPWLKEQVSLYSVDEDFKKVLDVIPSSKDFDVQVLSVLSWVRNNIEYVSDQEAWSMPEYWQTAGETLRLRGGDCEDGAVLAYVLCRLKGVPAERLLLMAGSVKGGGHCWLAYRPNEYPLNWAFLDWCYWPSGTRIARRRLFYVRHENIFEYSQSYGVDVSMVASNYYLLWFGFNEDRSYRYLDYRA